MDFVLVALEQSWARAAKEKAQCLRQKTQREGLDKVHAARASNQEIENNSLILWTQKGMFGTHYASVRLSEILRGVGQLWKS